MGCRGVRELKNKNLPRWATEGSVVASKLKDCPPVAAHSMLGYMGKWIANLLIAVATLSSFGAARCAASCAVKECANHSSRPAAPAPSGCPHNGVPDQKSQGKQPCSERQLMGESWLLSAKATASAVQVLGASVGAPAVPIPPVVWVEVRVADPILRLSLLFGLTIPLRI